MKQAFDQNSIRLTLQKAIQAGHFTLDDLDTPSPGFRACTRVDRRTFPGGYEGVQFRNLLRDGPPVVEKVQVIDDKDLPPMPNGYTPAEELDLPITLENSPF